MSLRDVTGHLANIIEKKPGDLEYRHFTKRGETLSKGLGQMHNGQLLIFGYP